MGGVLIFDDVSEFLSLHAAEYEADWELLKKELFNSYEWKEGWDKGTISTGEMVESVCKRLPERLHELVKSIAENWNMNPRIVPGMEHLIRGLKKSGWGVYLLSNTAVEFYKYRRHLPAIDAFDGEFISADHHVLKPHREIYEKFAGLFGLVPIECYFIDDKRENVEGAIAAGWGGGFHFTGDIAALEFELGPMLGIQNKSV